MRRRLIYVLPDVTNARRMMDDLLLARIEERHIHFLANPGVSMAGLHEANLLQKSDVVHGAQSGLLLGAGLGCAAGVAVAIAFQTPGGLPLVIVLIATVLGALFGVWVSTMIGSSVPNTRLKPYEHALEAGNVLLLVDVPHHRVDELRERLGAIHPEAEDRGLDPHVPAFP
jgi:hypothetical protein